MRCHISISNTCNVLRYEYRKQDESIPMIHGPYPRPICRKLIHAHHSKDHVLFHSYRFHRELMPLDKWVSRKDYDNIITTIGKIQFLIPQTAKNSFLFFRDYEQTSSFFFVSFNTGKYLMLISSEIVLTRTLSLFVILLVGSITNWLYRTVSCGE